MPRSTWSHLTFSLVSCPCTSKFLVPTICYFFDSEPFDAGKKLEDICPSTHNMEVPNVKRKDFQLIGVNDDFLSLMDDTGDMREDLKCPEDSIGDEIKAAMEKDADILVINSQHNCETFSGSSCQNILTFTTGDCAGGLWRGVCDRYQGKHCC